MKAFREIGRLFIILGFLISAQRCQGQEKDLAAYLLAKGGITKGICALPRCGNGEFAVAVARASGLLVHAQDPRPEAVAAAQRLADEQGLLGTRVIVERGGASPLPYADNVIDLVMVTDPVALRPGEGVSAAEILRVLRPRGKALLGGKIPLESELRRWLTEQGIKDAVVTKDAHGVWVEISKPAPQGVDAWGHWMHGPDNNPVSQDTVIKAPYLTQWLGRPYYTAMPVVTTAAAGRIFVAMGHIAHHDREVPTLNTIYARNGYNGAVLWQRKLPEGYLVHRSAFIATDDTFFMIDKDSALLLDPETGAEKGRIRIPDAQGEWKWMALVGRTLFVLAGESDPVEPTTIVRSQRDHWSWGELSKGYYQKPRIPWGFATTKIGRAHV